MPDIHYKHAMSLSLQQHLVGAQPDLAAVVVNPKGFKAAIQSLSNFLIAREVPATLWLKLPKDDAWWTDIWQYGQQAEGCTLYSLGTQTGNPPENLVASLRPIPIEQDADLKREYLYMAVAENFVATLLAVRQPASKGDKTVDKRSLQLYCSISGQVTSALSTGIRAAIESSLPDSADEIDAELGDSSPEQRQRSLENSVNNSSVKESSTRDLSIAGRAALSQWARLFSSSFLLPPTRALDSAFITWQLQAQTELREELSGQAKNDDDTALDALSPNFLSKASQELQSPLTTIKTALTLLGSPTLKLSQRQLYLEMIATQCDRQKSLISSVFDLLQTQTTPAQPASPLKLSDIVPGIVSTYQPIAEEQGIMLAHTIPPNLIAAMGVESELKAALIHLIQNGIEVTPKGGRVWVTATLQGTNLIALNVKDSGTGITKPDASRLFDAFYRSGDSAGLGLTLAKQLVEKMSGSIEVDSQPGYGTTFKILLLANPAAPSPSPNPATEIADTQPPSPQISPAGLPQNIRQASTVS